MVAVLGLVADSHDDLMFLSIGSESMWTPLCWHSTASSLSLQQLYHCPCNTGSKTGLLQILIHNVIWYTTDLSAPHVCNLSWTGNFWQRLYEYALNEVFSAHVPSSIGGWHYGIPSVRIMYGCVHQLHCHMSALWKPHKDPKKTCKHLPQLLQHDYDAIQFTWSMLLRLSQDTRFWQFCDIPHDENWKFIMGIVPLSNPAV